MAKMNADDWKGYPNIPETKADPKDAKIKQLQSENAALREAVRKLRAAATKVIDSCPETEPGDICVDCVILSTALAATAQWEA